MEAQQKTVMQSKNKVFIACSMDGYIADKDGGVEWLDTIPMPEGSDMGYGDFIANIDALLMGRKTFEKVLSFDVDWPYTKPVFVLSNTLKAVPPTLLNKVHIVQGTLEDALRSLDQQGYHRRWLDGGTLIQSGLAAQLIDELVITTIPVLLGGGIPLFGQLTQKQWFRCADAQVYPNGMMQARYVQHVK